MSAPPRFAYPISLDLVRRPAVVVGELAVAQGKVEGLLSAGAEVTAVATGPEDLLAALEWEPSVTVIRREYRAGDLAGAFLCVASSGDPEERRAIFHEAGQRGVLLNVMDDPAHCDWAAPAVVRRGALQIAVSTGGRSPALARRLREELEERFGPEWERLAELLGEVRDESLAWLPDFHERARRWQEALDLDELAALLREGRTEEARRRLVERLSVAPAR
jgi:siroheme synthase-like protein